MAALNLLLPVNAQTPAPKLPDGPNQAQPLDPKKPNILRPTTQDGSLLSVAGERLITEASRCFLPRTIPWLFRNSKARQVFNQMSTFIKLAASFSGIDNQCR